jgi:hypothetical protein
MTRWVGRVLDREAFVGGGPVKMQSFDRWDYRIAAAIAPVKSRARPQDVALHHENLIANCPKPGHSQYHGFTISFSACQPGWQLSPPRALGGFYELDDQWSPFGSYPRLAQLCDQQAGPDQAAF